MPAAVRTRLPAVQLHSAAQDGPLSWVGLVHNRNLRRAGIVEAEVDRPGQKVGPTAQGHNHRPGATGLSFPLANQLLGPLHGRQGTVRFGRIRFGLAAAPGVVALKRDVQVGLVLCGPARSGQKHPEGDKDRRAYMPEPAYPDCAIHRPLS